MALANRAARIMYLEPNLTHYDKFRKEAQMNLLSMRGMNPHGRLLSTNLAYSTVLF